MARRIIEAELERRDRGRSNEDSPEAQKVFVDCEAHGEAAVREMLKRNVFPPSARKWAEVWVQRRDIALMRAAASDQVEEARTANSIAREANSFARAANDLASSSNDFASKANDLAAAANDIASRAEARADKAIRQAAIANMIAAIAAAVAIAAATLSAAAWWFDHASASATAKAAVPS